jgi:hypothetical protein
LKELGIFGDPLKFGVNSKKTRLMAIPISGFDRHTTMQKYFERTTIIAETLLIQKKN